VAEEFLEDARNIPWDDVPAGIVRDTLRVARAEKPCMFAEITTPT
jgi:hypothetical protein